jgi:mRNA-degrading endonuclease YafQ of YafQ-DinJ toxin-antitoxin module
MSDPQPLRAVLATDRFLDNLFDFNRSYENVNVKVCEFIVHKQTWVVGERTAIKDYRLKGVLEGVWHYHVIFGQAILIYNVDPGKLKLYCIVSHDHIEDANKQSALAAYVAALKDTQFQAFVPQIQPPIDDEVNNPTLDEQGVETVRAMLYEGAAHQADRCLLDGAVDGNMAELFSFLHTMCEIEHLSTAEFMSAVLTAFGGQASFVNEVGKVLRETAVTH